MTMSEHTKGEQALLIRRVRMDDCEDIWRWRNDPEVRKFMFSRQEIPLAEHRAWFSKKLNDKDTVIYIFEDHQEKKDWPGAF